MPSRSAFMAAVLAASLFAAGPASAEPGDPQPSRPSVKAGPEAPRPGSLDELFGRLAAAKDEAEAKGIANLIERRLSRSGSDTADLLMSRAGEALEGKDAALAIELLDRVTQLRPDWAEAWHRRAAAFFILDDPADALADLHQALSREPRLFGAWVSLGQVRMSGGDKPGALLAFRKALALHPQLSEIKTLVERLSPEIEGRDL